MDDDEILSALADIDVAELLADRSDIDELLADTSGIDELMADIDADQILRSIG